MKFAYADPPYFGMGARIYGYPEWDDYARHDALLGELFTDYPDGWALSLNPRDLAFYLPACERRWPDVRVAAWVKTYHQIRPTRVQYAWEPVLLRGGRSGNPNPMVRDWYMSAATRMRGTPGAKPAGFCRWVLDMLGYDANEDELVDLFPGSGVMGHIAAQGWMTFDEIYEAVNKGRA